MSYADQLSDQISDHIGPNPNDNTVGNVIPQIYPDLSGTGQDDNASPIKKALTEVQKIAKSESQSPLGTLYGSPLTWTSHITNMSQFFKGGTPGNEYTNGFKKPQQNAPLQATDPAQFYAKWFESMRRFAEASEVADRGQTTVRSR